MLILGRGLLNRQNQGPPSKKPAKEEGSRLDAHGMPGRRKQLRGSAPSTRNGGERSPELRLGSTHGRLREAVSSRELRHSSTEAVTEWLVWRVLSSKRMKKMSTSEKSSVRWREEEEECHIERRSRSWGSIMDGLHLEPVAEEEPERRPPEPQVAGHSSTEGSVDFAVIRKSWEKINEAKEMWHRHRAELERAARFQFEDEGGEAYTTMKRLGGRVIDFREVGGWGFIRGEDGVAYNVNRMAVKRRGAPEHLDNLEIGEQVRFTPKDGPRGPWAAAVVRVLPKTPDRLPEIWEEAEEPPLRHPPVMADRPQAYPPLRPPTIRPTLDPSLATAAVPSIKIQCEVRQLSAGTMLTIAPNISLHMGALTYREPEMPADSCQRRLPRSLKLETLPDGTVREILPWVVEAKQKAAAAAVVADAPPVVPKGSTSIDVDP